LSSDLRVTPLKTGNSFAAIWPELGELRARCAVNKGTGAVLSAVENDVVLDTLHFLAATSVERRSCSVACWDRNRLVGVLFATEHWVRGLRTGYAIGGDFSGRGLALCEAKDERAVIEAAVRCIFADGVHSLHLRMVPRSLEHSQFPRLATKYLDAVIPGDHMNLGCSYDDFLITLGKHTRRNVRYYTRKTIEAGIVFEPSLSEDEFRRERARLNEKTLFPADAAHLERDDRFLILHDDRRMGLRAPDGRMVALLCGFTRGSRFHLLTQWNDPALEKLSLSVVLRGYTVEHLIEQKFEQLQFMGGTSLSFGRFCAPEQYRSLLLDRRYGVTEVSKRILAALCLKRAQSGKPFSFGIETLCGGFLDDSRLAKRTALNPASVAFIRSGDGTDSSHAESSRSLTEQAHS